MTQSAFPATPPIGPTAARIAELLDHSSVIAICADASRAEALHAALTGFTTRTVALLPEDDGIAGEASSAAVVAARSAALRAIGAARNEGPCALIASAEASAVLLPPAEHYAAQSETLRVGDPLEPEALAERLDALGYEADDRVDEPGEYAVRGAVVDIHGGGDAPVRLDVEEGRIAGIRRYDPVSQLGGEAVGSATLEPMREPSGTVSLFDHLPDARLFADHGSAERVAQLGQVAEESGARRSVADWAQRADRLDRFDVPGVEAGIRFVERRNPARAARAALTAARERGDRIAIVGAPRDLRFLARRLEEEVGEACDWVAVRAAEPGTVLALAAVIDRGWSEPGLTVIAAADLLGARAATAGVAPTVDPFGAALFDVRLGDALVHEEHGLGLLRGAEEIEGEPGGDALRLEYAGGTMRLVPAAEAAKLWRYGGGSEGLTLDRLDGSSWTRRRAEIDVAIAETARELVALASERAKAEAPALSAEGAPFERIVAGFGFAPTSDQAAAFEAVARDLGSGRPMDRLVIGDVGYGKTEVALRAAAIAALAGRQVAIVAPTTVLARQHLETIRRRFRGSGLEIASLSRLNSPAEARAAKAGLADGSVSIVVGTTAIAARGVRYDRLGLVVIDEEQRFGAAAKAKLRGLAEGVHVLSLTATPIPRTLQGALVGLQQMSVLATPPARRRPIRTRVTEYDPALVRAALLREKKRGGQSFVVVPRIEDMAAVAEDLGRLVPDLALVQAHGKMPAAEIDEAMIGFAEGRGDVLLATNIIEAGLDVPRANTMVVMRADRFGLAQLHQLRGRVGRGRVRGQILLFTEAGQRVAPATLARLRTLEALDRLGAGFAISQRDLDLRGAGELLGERQAGHLALIGTDLYQHLLGLAVRAARGEPAAGWAPELQLGVAGALPSDWIPEADLRATLHLRLAHAGSIEEIDALGDELEDRFGALPAPAARLVALARLAQLARAAGIARVDAGPAAIALTPFERGDPPAGLEAKEGRWILREPTEADDARLARVAKLLEEIGHGE